MREKRDFMTSILWGGLTKEEYRVCISEIRKQNCTSLLTALMMMTIVFVVMMAYSLYPGALTVNDWSFCNGFAAALIAEHILYWFYFRTHPRWIMVLFYCVIATAYAFGIYHANFLGSDSYCGTFCTMLVTIPMLITDVPIRLIASAVSAETVMAVIWSCRLNAGITPGDRNALVSSLVCVFISGYCAYSIQKTKHNAIYSNLLVEAQRDTDIMTGAYSRTAYIRDLEEMKNTDIPAGVVFADVNGLKQANDLKGHKAGDELIKEAHALLTMFFGTEKDRIYRIGGDEFVIISHEEIESSFRNRFEMMTQKDSFGELVSCGCVWIKEICQMEKGIRKAESLMYESKGRFYASHPDKDRRTV